MITLDDLPEMLADWRAGELSDDDAHELCYRLLVGHEVDELLPRLPPDFRDGFVQSMQRFDNAIPPEDYIWFNSGSGDNPHKVEIIRRVRAWHARQRQV